MMLMKKQYRLFKRTDGIYSLHNNFTNKQESLSTRDKAVAVRLFNARTKLISNRPLTSKLPKAIWRRLMSVSSNGRGPKSWLNL